MLLLLVEGVQEEEEEVEDSVAVGRELNALVSAM